MDYCQPTIKKVTGERNAIRLIVKTDRLKNETMDLISEGMYQACQTGGTGWPLFDFTINKATNSQSNLEATSSGRQQTIAVPIACKTGTAEYGDPKNKTHAWFTSFAPDTRRTSLSEAGIAGTTRNSTLTGDPELSVTVLVEGAGEGSNVAAPIAKKIYEAWFSR